MKHLFRLSFALVFPCIVFAHAKDKAIPHSAKNSVNIQQRKIYAPAKDTVVEKAHKVSAEAQANTLKNGNANNKEVIYELNGFVVMGQ